MRLPHGRLLAVLGFLSFVFVYNNVSVAAILLQLSAEFDTTAGGAGLLVAAYSLPSIFLAPVLGPFADRHGRRRFLIAGAVLSGAATIGAGLSTSFAMLLILRCFSGMGAAVVLPNMNAVLADSFTYRTRGRAVGYIISAQTGATILGVPLSGLIAALLSWRVALALVGALTLGAALMLRRYLAADRVRAEPMRAIALYRRVLADPRAMFAILSAFLGSTFWFTWTTYFVSFFQRTFGLPLAVASILSATTGIGVLIGSNVGGRIGDRIGHRSVLAGSLFVAAGLIIALTNAPIGIAAAAALNLALCVASGARMPTNQAVLGEQAPDAQATMWGIVWAAISIGVVTGAVVGGSLLDTLGYGAVGLFAGGAAIASGLVVAGLVREERTGGLAAV